MHDLSDAGFIRRFSKVMGGVGVIIVVCFIVAGVMSIGYTEHPAAEKALKEQRLAPAASVATTTTASASAGTTEVASAQAAPAEKTLSGKQVVGQVCSACHGTGVMGAPKIGSKADWEPRFKSQGGLDGLVKHAIHGLGNMPPRGGNADLSDQDIHNAVKYMLSKAGISG